MDAVIIAGTALALLLTACAPDVAPSTMAAIVAVESSGNAFALNDNTAHRSYAPRGYADALSTARALITQGHSVDVGIAQVNSGNFAAFHTTASEMLHPCRNLQVASNILAGDYAAARSVFTAPRALLWHAISAYNTGSLYAGKAYVDLVIAAASRVPLVPPIALLTADNTSNRPVSAVVSASRVASAASKTVRMIRKPHIYDFAFTNPDTKTLVITFSSLRGDTESIDRK